MTKQIEHQKMTKFLAPLPFLFVQFAVSRSVGCCMLASHRQYDEVYVYRGVTSCSGHRCCGFAREYATTLCVCSCSLLFVNDHVILFCSFPLPRLCLFFVSHGCIFHSKPLTAHKPTKESAQHLPKQLLVKYCCMRFT